jgi:hypothetical protein
MRAMFQRRPSPLGAALAVFSTALLLCLPFAPAKDEENLRFFLDWRPEIEPLLLLGVIAVLALAGRRLPGALRWLLALLIFIAALVQFVDAVVLSFLDRELDLFFDLPHVPKLLSLFAEAAGVWRATAAVMAAVLGGVAVIWLFQCAVAAVERALRPSRHAAVCLGIIAATLGTAAVSRVGEGQALVGERTLPVIAGQAARLYRAFAVTHGYDRRYDAALAAPQPAPGPLPGLKHRDVYLVFFESYGTVVLDDPRYAARIAPALADFAATTTGAGYHLLSSRIVSPTFGGGSWLAHGTIDAGLKLDPLLTRLITDTGRQTLPRYLRAAGYRSVEVMPGLKTPEPEHGFWGFAQSYYAADLGYDGPPFGWFDIPDQYTLRRLDAIEGAAGHEPLFAQIVLVSSHTPFAPVPPYVADWSDAGAYRSVSQTQWDHIYAPPDWAHLEAPYLESVVYDLRTLGAWLAGLAGDALVIIVGDHQPPGFVSGEKQPWTVPIHVLSRDPDLVRPFEALGYVEGAAPPRQGPFKAMESFLGDFITGFAQAAPLVAAHPETSEHAPD